MDFDIQLGWAVGSAVLIAFEVGLMLWEARHPSDTGLSALNANWRVGLSFGMGALGGTFVTVGLASRGAWAAPPVGLATLTTFVLTAQYFRHAFSK
ncbi:MAG: hypothetical protein ACYDGR_13870 [Candidatus Dormibacteria bacterium]